MTRPPLGTLTAAIEARDVVAMVGVLYVDEFRALAERLPTDDPALSRLLLLVYSADRVAEAEQAWTATKVEALVASAPPMSDTQRAKMADLLAAGGA